MTVTMNINQKSLLIEGDTGTAVSLISTETYKNTWCEQQRPELHPSSRRLRTYTGEEQRCVIVKVHYNQQTKSLSLLVVTGNGPSLLGQDWLDKIWLDWQSLHHLGAAPPTNLQSVLSSPAEVFKDELGQVKGSSAQIIIEPNATPKFCKPRTVPFALCPEVEEELQLLEKAGVIESVQFSTWAAPIVPVLKKGGSNHIYGDYTVIVNRVTCTNSFPLPRIDDIFAPLAGEKTF